MKLSQSKRGSVADLDELYTKRDKNCPLIEVKED